jgi:hypothetical protein
MSPLPSSAPNVYLSVTIVAGGVFETPWYLPTSACTAGQSASSSELVASIAPDSGIPPVLPADPAAPPVPPVPSLPPLLPVSAVSPAPPVEDAGGGASSELEHEAPQQRDRATTRLREKTRRGMTVPLAIPWFAEFSRCPRCARPMMA